MKPLAAFAQSAPSAINAAMSNALTTFPAAPIRTRSRRPAPTRVLCTNSRPSRSGTPIWFMNSSGDAPVPPSAPSTTMKSGTIPVSRMALTVAMNSQGSPTHSLNPTGFPPESFLSSATKCIISSGVEKARWRAGERQSSPIGHAARLRDLARHLGRRENAAVTGLGALAELDLDHPDLLGLGFLARSRPDRNCRPPSGIRNSRFRSPR